MNVVVIPAYKVKEHILDVINGIGSNIDRIIVVDDHCPENSGKLVVEKCQDKRIEVLFNEKNLGVGGAVIRGYERAIELKAELVIKVDGDGQMDTALISEFIETINKGADYVKGNRFHYLEALKAMPKSRLFGNSVLSLVNKAVSGYWNILDPTNGFTCIRISILKRIPLKKLDNRYFFESDMLFHLGLIKAVVIDLPIPSKYADEKSSLRIKRVLFEFPPKYLSRFFKRIFYMYFLYDFNVASIELVLGVIMLLFGTTLGISFWLESVETGIVASSGSVMLSALPIILGFQLLLSALNYDINNTPKKS